MIELCMLQACARRQIQQYVERKPAGCMHVWHSQLCNSSTMTVWSIQGVHKALCDKQVWRPLTGPVQDSPLGIVDAATLALEDILPVQVHVPGGVVREVNFIAHNPKHR